MILLLLLTCAACGKAGTTELAFDIPKNNRMITISDTELTSATGILHVENTSAISVTCYLYDSSGANTALDSAEISSGQSADFSLSDPNAAYRLGAQGQTPEDVNVILLVGK